MKMKMKLVLSVAALLCGVASGSVNLRFGFITDTHINASGSNLERVRGAFTLFKTNDVDLVVHAGDLANAHYPAAYTALSNLFDEVFAASKPRFIAVVGNHDTQMELGSLTQLDAAEETLALAGVENTHTDVRTVNGYTFLTMPYAIGNTAQGFLSWAEYEAAVSNACEQAGAGRPVFVVEHEPPQDTIYNSHNWGYPQSKEILARYPQVVELSGHVHGSLHSDLFLWQGGFTVLNAACLSNWQGLLKGVAAPGGQNKEVYDALIVDVEDARIVVRRHDVLTGEEIDPDHRWEFPLPFAAATAPYNYEARVAAEVAPAFGADDVLTITPGATCRSFTLDFPEVATNALTYWITVESWNGSAWTTNLEQEVFGEFWKQTAARTGHARVSVADDAFEPCTDYRVSVQPVGQYGTRGAALVATVTTATAGEKPDCLVEYVRSNGTQYFDTGVTGRSGTKMEMDIVFDEVGGDTAVLDCRKDETESRFFLFHTSAGFAAYGYGKYQRQDQYPLVANRRYHVATELRAGLQTLDIDGARVATGSNAATIDTGANLYLFACNFVSRGNPALYAVRARVYSLKIWQTDTNGVYRLVRDFAPCMAPVGLDSDNASRRTHVGALFDRVTERIFYSRKVADRSSCCDKGGTDACAYLPDTWCTTSPGRPDIFVEYICSSGGQILDTGVPARAGLRLEGDLMYYTSFNSTEEVFLGVTAEGHCTIVDRPWGKAWGSLGYYAAGRYFTNETTGVAAGWNLKQKYHVTCDFRAEGESTITQDGAVVYRTPGTAHVTGQNLMMFAAYRNGWPAYTSKARCYGLKLWLDGVPARDFRPCVKDGKPGLYDTVRNEVVFPLGDLSACTVGETVNEDGSPNTIPWVQTLNSQFVDLGVIGRSGTKVEMDFLFPNANNGGDHGVIGARGNASTDSRFYLFHNHVNCGRLGYRTFKYLDDPLSANERHHVESELRAGRQVVTVDGTEIYTGSDAAELDTGINLYLGAVNVAGTASYSWALRVFSLKIWQTDTTAASDTDYKLVRDFVPVIANDKGGLLDRVSGTVFTPKTTVKDGDVRFRVSTYEANKVAGPPDALVEYIESDGRQILQTGVQVQPGLAASGEVMWTGRFDEEQTHLGVHWWPNRLYFVHNVVGNMWFGYTSGFGHYPLDSETGEKIPWGRNVRRRYDVDYSNPAHMTADLDGVRIMDEPSTNMIAVSESALAMFGALLSEGYCDYFSKSRCYWSQIRVNGEVVRDFLPCVKNGKGGLYDTVHDEVYFPKIGEITGGLIGPITNASALAANSYVSYVESDGNAWIDTGVTGRSGTKTQIEFTPLWTPNAGNDWSRVDQGIVGARAEPWGDTRFYPAHSFGGVYISGYGGLTHTAALLTDRAAHRVESELRAGLQRVTFDGATVVAETSGTTIDTGRTMYLGAVNVGGEAQFRSPMRIHRVKIWQTATTNADDVAYALVRDYKPVVTAGGIIGLKDAVHGTLALPASPFVACGEPLATGCTVILR